MIILELFLFFLSITIFSISFAGYGSFLTDKDKSNFFLDIFFGFILISLIVTSIHFFFKINFSINILILFLGLIIFYKNKKNSLDLSKIFKRENFLKISVILLLIPMFLSHKYHEDFGYYHLPYALTFLEEKIVFGLGNIDVSHIYNSIWLNLYPLFFLENRNFDYLTLPSFLLFLSFVLFSINKIYNRKHFKVSDYYLSIILFYFLLKFTRLSEFGVDFPATIFSILSILYFIKYYESNGISNKKSFFYYNFVFSIFSILIKLSAIPIIILPIYIYFSNFKNFKFYIFNHKFLIVYFLCLIFLIQQFIYTGCFLFPTNLTCFNVNWFNADHINLSKKLELINKSYSLAKDEFTPEEYLSNFNWFSFWIKRNYIEIIEHLATIVLPLLIFIFVLKKREESKIRFEKKIILYFFIFFSLLFWLYFSPVFRFAIHIFSTLVFLIFSIFLISRKFSKKKFIILVSIFLVFNFSKNILRINETGKVFLGVQKIENKFILDDFNSNEHAKIYFPDVKNNEKNGWQGRLCWNTPFICSYNKLDVSKKNGYLIINKLKN